MARARRILEAADEVVTLARSQRDPLAGRLRVGLLPTIGPYLLPRVAPLVRRKLPRLELRLYEYQTGVMLEKLRAGELDLGDPRPAGGAGGTAVARAVPGAVRGRPARASSRWPRATRSVSRT